MQKLRDDFFSSSAFPLYQYRQITLKSALDRGPNFAHRRRSAKDDRVPWQVLRIDRNEMGPFCWHACLRFRHCPEIFFSTSPAKVRSARHRSISGFFAWTCRSIHRRLSEPLLLKVQTFAYMPLMYATSCNLLRIQTFRANDDGAQTLTQRRNRY